MLKATARGREFYAKCKGATARATAQNVENLLTVSGLSVPGELLQTMRVALSSEVSLGKKLSDAEAARATVQGEFRVARARLKVSVSVLRATLSAHSIGGRRASAPVRVVSVAQVSTPAPVLNGKHHRGAQHHA